MYHYSLSLRVDVIDESLGEIVDKLETALEKMTLVEKTRAIKIESMSKILDVIIDDNDGCKFSQIFLKTINL